MSVEERQKWFQEFQASDAGKQYQERLAKTDAARRKRTVTADAEGKFSFNDGFAGTCGLFGQKEVTHEGRTYIADFFAEIPVGEGVRFLDLGDLPLTVRRILQTGEAAPDLRLRPTPDGHTDDDSGAAAKAEKSLVKLAKFSGKPVLLCFWTRESLERIREPLSGLLEDKPAGLEVIGVNLDEPSAELDQFLSQQSLAWTVLQTSGLETAPVALDYGILAIPGFCLIDKQGKVLLNDDRFFEAFGQPEATIRSVVAAAIDGQ
jgi:peroxiredoxin